MQNFTPKPFTPSPIAQEKIAIFDQPAKSYQSPIRRPLTIPNQVVRNKSPAPYGAGSPYDNGYGGGSWQQQQLAAPQPQLSYPAANPYQSNRLSGCSFTSSSTYAPSSSTLNAMPIPSQQSPRVHFDLSHQENYNRAARGWGQSRDYYRPIAFTKTQSVELPYTDF